MKLADPVSTPVAAKRACECEEPWLQTRTSGKWATDRYCERCGRLAAITFKR